MEKIVLIICSVLLCQVGSAQVYFFKNESKLMQQKKPDKWNSKLKYNDFNFEWYGQREGNYSDTNRYALRKQNDTIFLCSVNGKSKFNLHPQYPLTINDTLIYLQQNSDGLNNGSSQGSVILLKDTTVIVKNINFECYLFKRFINYRDRTEIEYVCLDKTSLVPVVSNTYFFMKSDMKKIATAYRKCMLVKLKKVH